MQAVGESYDERVPASVLNKARETVRPMKRTKKVKRPKKPKDVDGEEGGDETAEGDEEDEEFEEEDEEGTSDPTQIELRFICHHILLAWQQMLYLLQIIHVVNVVFN